MNEPILPDLPAGFYLAPVNGFAPTIFELRGGCWYDDRGSWRSDPRIALNTVHSIPALLSAADERDALKVRMDEALSVLTELSSRYDNDLGINVCAICGSEVGHKPDCSLAAVLAKAKS